LKKAMTEEKAETEEAEDRFLRGVRWMYPK
jgi:hypothetical protein